MNLNNIHRFANTGKMPTRLRKKLSNKICTNCGKRYGVHLMSGKHHKSRCPSSDNKNPRFFKGVNEADTLYKGRKLVLL